MSAEKQEFAVLAKDRWREVVGKLLAEKASSSGRVLLCVTGKTGAGKTTFARDIRRAGLPGFKPSEIAVIDDGVMTAPLFGLINRRIRFSFEARDELAPFEPYLRGKKVVVYVAIHPELRITRCDVLIRLRCNDEERRQRLVSSRDNGEARYGKSLVKSDETVVTAGVRFELRTD